MALPASGSVKFSDLNLELSKVESRSSNSPISLNTLNVRRLLKTQVNPTNNSQIKMSETRSKSSTFEISHTNIVNGFTGTSPGQLLVGWNGVAKPILTITNANSSSTATAAITVNGSYVWGITLKLYGTIAGRGASSRSNTYAPILNFEGGVYYYEQANIAGLPGGPALSINVPCRVENYGEIVGGGGSGGNDMNSLTFTSTAYGPSLDSARMGGCGSGGWPDEENAGRQDVYSSFGNQTFFGAGAFTRAYINSSSSYVVLSQFYGGSGGGPGSAGTASVSPAGKNGAGGAAGISVKGTNFVSFAPQGILLGPTSPT